MPWSSGTKGRAPSPDRTDAPSRSCGATPRSGARPDPGHRPGSPVPGESPDRAGAPGVDPEVSGAGPEHPSVGAALRRIEKNDLSAPARIVEIERTEVAEEGIDVSSARTLWCLGKDRGVPSQLSFWDVSDDESVLPRSLASPLPHRPPGSVAPVASPLSRALTLTICVCTRERPDEVRRLLAHLEDQSDRDFEVLIVDNAPTDGATREVARDPTSLGVRYEVEPVRGLSRARNRGLTESSSDLVAWLDDDERPDRHWVRSLRAGFDHPCRPAAVVGSIFPAELETPAQVLFETYGGFNKGRGLAPEVLRRHTSRVRSALYPSPSLGSGGNMAYLRRELLSIGGFDTSL
ncbi:glycosyltransferase, partial [Acidimicrobiaceae bacterium USS-CC1]|nr:glycosyltransferase [Acidiferrimicrobium australe]